MLLSQCDVEFIKLFARIGDISLNSLGIYLVKHAVLFTISLFTGISKSRMFSISFRSKVCALDFRITWVSILQASMFILNCYFEGEILSFSL